MSSRAAGDWSRNDAVTQWEAAYVERDANLFWPVVLNHREKEGGETSIMPTGWHAVRMVHIQPTRGDIYHSEEAGLFSADSEMKKKRIYTCVFVHFVLKTGLEWILFSQHMPELFIHSYHSSSEVLFGVGGSSYKEVRIKHEPMNPISALGEEPEL